MDSSPSFGYLEEHFSFLFLDELVISDLLVMILREEALIFVSVLFFDFRKKLLEFILEALIVQGNQFWICFYQLTK